MTRSGENTVEIAFTAGDQSLNRNDSFLYTLLVPERARTLFPCFDQPDMKALYTLSLEVPADWKAVSNIQHVYRKRGTDTHRRCGRGARRIAQTDNLLPDRATEHLPLLLRGRRILPKRL